MERVKLNSLILKKMTFIISVIFLFYFLFYFLFFNLFIICYFFSGFGSQFIPPSNRFKVLKQALLAMMKEKKISLIFSITDPELNKQLSEEFSPYKQIYISRWVNQRAVLNHKNVKLFFTHGGLSGLAE
jgi:hypothetical protein